MADFNLPNEILCMIFSYLPLAPKKNATATCKLWSRLIRADSKLSRHILISWCNMETALETLQWNWNNWPALQTLELKYPPLTVSREAIQNAIEKLSLKHCPASLKEVIFNFDLTPLKSYQKSYGQSLLKYKPYTAVQIIFLFLKKELNRKLCKYQCNNECNVSCYLSIVCKYNNNTCNYSICKEKI